MQFGRYLLVVAALSLAAVAAAGQDTSVQHGVASWYGGGFHGRTTSNGEVYDMEAYTAAHRTLPFNSRVRVTNRENGRQVVVRINDRGPFVAGRIIDLSRAAATFLDMLGPGTVPVRIEVLPQASSEQRVFAVQVGAFVKPGNAQRVQHELRAAGIEAVIEKTPALVTRVLVDHVQEDDLGATLRLVASFGFADCLVRERGDR